MTDESHLRSLIVGLRAASSYKDASDFCHQIVQIGPTAIDELIPLLDHRVEHVRVQAAEALGAIGDRRALDSLRAAYASDSSYEVRSRVAISLGRLGDFDALRKALKDPEPHVRGDAASELAKIADRSEAVTLLAVFRDRTQTMEYRQGALDTLARMKHKEVVEGLVDALNDSESFVRRGAADALGYIKDSSAAPAIRRLLNDPDYHVRCFVLDALKKIQGGDALDALVAALDDGVYLVRNRAINNLCD